MCVAKDFFVAFTDPRYHESYGVFILTCISMAAVGLSQYTNKAWELNKNTKMILALNIVAAVLNIVLNFIFIPIYGYYVAIITTLISYVFYLAVSLIMSRKTLKLKVNVKSLIKVIISSICMYVAILIFKNFAMNMSNVIKVILEVIIGIIVYFGALILLGELNKKEIKLLYEDIKNRGKKKYE